MEASLWIDAAKAWARDRLPELNDRAYGSRARSGGSLDAALGRLEHRRWSHGELLGLCAPVSPMRAGDDACLAVRS